MRSSGTKRFFSVFLALVLVLCLCAIPVTAAEDLTAEEKAQALNALGLFGGKEDNPDGTPNFKLEDSATRNEAATMLIRLMGKESKAAAQYAAGTLQNPFVDTSWAAASVAWLYEAGYANGTDDVNHLYGAEDTVTAQQFATFILRALGYSDDGGDKSDFTYNSALDFAVKKGVLTAQQRSAWERAFLREGMAEMSYNALYLNMNNSRLTLLEKLTNDGIFKASYDTTLSGLAPMTLTLKYSGGGHENTEIGRYYVQEGSTASPCGDVDGDGKPEIVFNVRTVYCLDAATGNIKWMCPSGHDVAEPNANFFGQPTNFVPSQIVDLDGDGMNEIVTFTTSYSAPESYGPVSVMAVYDGTGHFKFAPVYFNYRIHAVKIADLDGNGTKEIAVGVGVGDFYPTTKAGSIYVYNCDGTLRSGWPADCEYGVFGNTIEAVDLDGDSQLELIVLNDQEWIAAYNAGGGDATINGGVYAGKKWREIAVWENYEYEQEANLHPYETYQAGKVGVDRESSNSIGGTHGGVVAADLDGDGVKELVFTAMIIDNGIVHAHMDEGTGTSFGDSLQYFTTFILKLNHDRYTNAAKGFDWTQMPTDIGTPLTLEDYNNLTDPDIAPVVADLDGDGNMEIIFGSYDGKVHCFSLDGTEHGAWPFSLDGRSTPVLSMAGKPAAADLNGDGKQEVVFATYPEQSSQGRGTLYVLDYSGKVLAQVKLPPHQGNTEMDQVFNGCYAEPTIADVDNDGKLEIIVTTYSAGVCVYEIN